MYQEGADEVYQGCFIAERLQLVLSEWPPAEHNFVLFELRFEFFEPVRLSYAVGGCLYKGRFILSV